VREPATCGSPHQKVGAWQVDVNVRKARRMRVQWSSGQKPVRDQEAGHMALRTRP
jgi:hypothetical protein